jgi:ABC-type transport system involved in multi-copper enzyme maturation permease subunit
MTAQLRAELLKQRSVRTGIGLFATMVALVLLAVALHGFGLPAHDLARRHNQLEVLGRGELLGTLFAALLGAVSITAEYRHGTIRPTVLAMPRRGRVLAGKLAACLMIGTGFGLAAGALAVGIGAAALRARGIDMTLDSGDYALLIAGSGVAAALWAAIGVGVGALVRDQVPALVGISAWLLFVEGLFGGSLAQVTRFLPGGLGMAASGQEPDTLLAPGLSVVLLALYAVAAAAVGCVATIRRDVT